MTGVAVATTRSYARATAIGAVVIAVSWHLGNNLTCTVTGWGRYRWPGLVAAAWLAIAALTILGAVDMLSPRARRRPALALAGVPILLLSVEAVLVSARGPQVISNANWGMDSSGWFAMVLLWRWPMRWLATALTANWVISFAVMLATGPVDRIDISRFVIVMYVSAALQIVVAGGAVILQRTAVRAARAAAEQAELAAARQAAEAVHADRQRRYREIGDVVRDLLAGLASGDLDPADPAVRRRCAVEASRLRRLIAEHDDVPSPLVHELRACADLAERREVRVALEMAGTPPPLPRQVRRALTEAPMLALAGARSHARVTVFSAAEPGEVEVSVVADAGDELAGPPATPGATDIDVTWSKEGGMLWVRAHWSGR